ncbi:hypothetical protein DXG01_011808, partial [Tephrocybe rancida]
KDQDAFWKIVTRGHAVLTGPIVTALYGPASSAPRLHSLTILAQDGSAFDAVLDFFDESPFVEKSTPPDAYPGFATCFLLRDLEVHIQDVRFKHEVYEPAFDPRSDFPGILTHQSLLLTTPFEELFHNTPFWEPFYTGHSVPYRGRSLRTVHLVKTARTQYFCDGMEKTLPTHFIPSLGMRCNTGTGPSSLRAAFMAAAPTLFVGLACVGDMTVG